MGDQSKLSVLDYIRHIGNNLKLTILLVCVAYLLGGLLIGMGSHCNNQCKIEHGRISIFLIVFGITYILLASFRIVQYRIHQYFHQESDFDGNIVDDHKDENEDSEAANNETPADVVEKGRADDPTSMKIIGLIVEVLLVFLLSWFIVGSLWVFRNNNSVVHEDVKHVNYCSTDCFHFAFWFLIVHFIFLIMLLSFVVGIAVVSAYQYRTQRR